jgi:mono/diheme cytochrome c family protein
VNEIRVRWEILTAKCLLQLTLLLVASMPSNALADLQSVHANTPAELASQTNPIPDNDETRRLAADLYGLHCVVCHGEKGDGRGPGSRGLRPQPLVYANAELMAQVTDGQLFWAIQNGSEGSAMIPWKNLFSDSETWTLVRFIRRFSSSSTPSDN